MLATLAQLAGEGKSAKEIGGALGLSRNAVIGKAARTNVRLKFQRPPAEPRPPRPPRVRIDRPDATSVAERKAARRLTRDIARAMYLAGDTYAAISAETGYAVAYIPLITRGLPRRRQASGRTGRRYGLEARVALVADVLSGSPARRVSLYWGTEDKTIARYLAIPDVVEAAHERANEILNARDLVMGADRALAALIERDVASERDAVNRPILAAMPARDRAAMLARIAGETLQQVGDRHGITRERVRQIEVRWRLCGLVIPGVSALTEASRRAVYGPTGRPAGTTRKQQKAKRDVFAVAHAILDAETGKRQHRAYSITDHERARRSEHMRRVSKAYWEAKA